jgi:hypothetical protein
MVSEDRTFLTNFSHGRISLYSSVAERQSCKLKVLGSIPSGGSLDNGRRNNNDDYKEEEDEEGGGGIEA